MRDEYDFSKGKRGAIIPSLGKSRMTIMLDDDIIEHSRAQAESEGVGYQTLINSILRKAVMGAGKAEAKPLTVATLAAFSVKNCTRCNRIAGDRCIA